MTGISCRFNLSLYTFLIRKPPDKSYLNNYRGYVYSLAPSMSPTRWPARMIRSFLIERALMQRNKSSRQGFS